jgi:hypothetical protein
MLHRSCLQALDTEGIVRDSDYSEPSSSSGYCPAAGPFGRAAPPTTMKLPGGRHPGEQRPVIHRELRITRRISREDLQDRAQDSISAGDLTHTNGDSHEEPEHALFQTHRLCSRSRYERLGFGRPRISLRAAVAPEHLSDRFRESSRRASGAQLVPRLLSSAGTVRAPALARDRRIKDAAVSSTPGGC